MTKLKYLSIGLFLCITFWGCKKEDASPSNQKPTSPKTEISIEKALFTNLNDVKDRKSDPVILNSLIHYIKNTPKGDSIYMSIYLLSYQPLISAIKYAERKGVVLKILIDNSNSETSIDINKTTIAELNAILTPPSQLTTVTNNITNSSINHEKYVLFSKVELPQGVAKNIVFSTSHNFMESSTKKSQDAVVMTNKELYDIFLSNWHAVKDHSNSNMKDFTYSVESVGDSIKAFFFPRRVNVNKDPIVEILNKLSDYSKDTICIGMAGFTNPRIRIANKLVDLQENGAQVEIITREENSSGVLDELAKLPSKGGFVKLLNTSSVNLHSKFMLIKGVWDGKFQTLILCGSENYSGNALYNNNEQMLMLKNSVLFKDYWSHFKKMKYLL